jgi:hypothetical protein
VKRPDNDFGPMNVSRNRTSAFRDTATFRSFSRVQWTPSPSHASVNNRMMSTDALQKK